MEFRQLQYILTIAQEQTLLAAAEKLFITPSALSQFVSRLEGELKTPLFKRTKSGWIPTYAGQLYIDMAKEILIKEQNTRLKISDIAEDKVGHFTIGVTPGRGTLMFSSVFPKFKALYPNIKVGLYEGTVLNISEMIAGGKVDIGFVTSVLEYPNVVTQHQAGEKIVLAVPKSHPMAFLAENAPDGELATVDLRLFKDDEFLLAGEGTTLRTLADRAFSAAGFSPKIAFETLSLSTLHTLSKSGFGLSFVPRFYVDSNAEAVYFYTDPPLSWELVVAYRRGSYRTQAQKAMIDMVTQYYLSTEEKKE